METLKYGDNVISYGSYFDNNGKSQIRLITPDGKKEVIGYFQRFASGNMQAFDAENKDLGFVTHKLQDLLKKVADNFLARKTAPVMFAIIDADTQEQFSTQEFSSEKRAFDRRNELAIKYGKEFCLEVVGIDANGKFVQIDQNQ